MFIAYFVQDITMKTNLPVSFVDVALRFVGRGSVTAGTRGSTVVPCKINLQSKSVPFQEK